ncbi:phosphotransferase [Cellulomonas sp. NPDC089187]|uniref:phosphotransferase enzyme family protein n=1 Tax=Cellulomonas sp. NPDC089187 TaxID=3154970 RepID=UPI00344649AA
MDITRPQQRHPGPVAGLVALTCPPEWLRVSICAAWGWDVQHTRLHLIAADLHASFLVVVDDLPVAVARLSVPPYMEDTAAAESEVAWMMDLDAAGVVRVPAVITPADGRDVALLADEDDRHWICLATTLVPTTPPGDDDSRLRMLGTTAARMHEHALSYHRPRDFIRPTWDTTDLVGPDARWGNWRTIGLDPTDHTVLARAEQAALDVLHLASRAPDSWGLVHGDLRPEKVVAGPDGVTVLDFDSCGFSWFMLDLAAALSASAGSPRAPEQAQAWIEGYQEVRPLTLEDARAACALVVLRQLQWLGRSGGADEAHEAVRVGRAYLRDAGWLVR